MKNNKYTKEFKDESVQLILNSGKSTVAIAKDLGINEKTLYNWVSAYKQKHNITSSHKTTHKEQSANEELIRLRKENKLLRQERDILKKATAYFAKETL